MKMEELRTKLTIITEWIDNTLIAHAPQARTVGGLGFKRLPNYYSQKMLEFAKVVIVEQVPIPPLAALGLPALGEFDERDYDGITFKDTFFIKKSRVNDESIYFHELVHVVQWTHLGVDRFLLAYADGLLKNGYRKSPLEEMAYDLQKYFENNGQPVDVAALIRNKLDEIYPQEKPNHG